MTPRSESALGDGAPYPLGAVPGPGGVNVALFSAHATAVELCVFDAAGENEVARYVLPCLTDEVWHGFLPGAGPGLIYGFRVHGPWAPAEGHRFNPRKLMLDPYARRLVGTLRWDDAIYDHRRDPLDTAERDERDSAPFVPKSVVTAPCPPPAALPAPIPWDRTVLYEAHLRGLTVGHPGVTPALRGTYGGLVEPAVLSHVRALGITAVELLPVHEGLSEGDLVRRGLTNFWNYNTIAFFAPERRYAAEGTDAAAEFRAMAASLHAAGIELVLDVVYNHTAEGNGRGPSLCFKGIDNRSYYRLLPDDPGHDPGHDPGRYVNDTGCGNTLNLDHPRVLQLVMDSLRFWAGEMGVDGFRFDLAPVLGRTPRGFEPGAGFFQACRQDPSLQGVKLMAEAWDCGPGGYQVGNFPPGWGEWNDRFRDDVRAFWRGAPDRVGVLASRLSGSAGLFEHRGRRPWASINFAAVHDGSTLRDLVSFERKHNEANGEDNRDGTGDGGNWNHGVEGPSDDPAVEEARRRDVRNLLATVFASQGTPLLLAGDERGRSQGGNNNAYCQDNAVSWVDWEPSPEADAQLEFTRLLSRLRREYPVLRRPRFFDGRWKDGLRDADWIHPNGEPMRGGDWTNPDLRCVGMLLDGRVPSGGEPSATILVLLNAGAEAPFTLPNSSDGDAWRLLADTADPGAPEAPVPGPVRTVSARSVLFLARTRA